MTTPSCDLHPGPPPTPPDAGEVLRRFAHETPGVLDALLLTLNGQQIAATSGLDHDLAHLIAATASTLIALARQDTAPASAAKIVNSRCPNMHMLVMPIAGRAGLAVVSDLGGDPGVIGYQMSRLADAVADRLNREVWQPQPARPPPRLSR
jgi:uncharacterized protein